MYVKLRAKVTGLTPILNRLMRALDADAKKAFRRIGRLVASDAKANHTFTNRTHTLENSIKSLEPEGSLVDNTLSVTVVAEAPYANHVEEKESYAYLKPALERNRAQFSSIVGDALSNAVARAKL
jgi:hypothetical protein